MAKSKLTAGADIDMLNEQELRAALGPFFMLLSKTEEINIFNADDIFIANAAGVLVSQSGDPALYRVPNGYFASIHRIEINAPGASAIAPITGAGISMGFFMNDPTVYGNQFYPIPATVGGVVAPVVITEGSLSAKTCRPGEQIYVVGSGFLSGQNISVRLQIRLAPLTRKMKGQS